LQKVARKVTKYSPDVYMASGQNQTHVSFLPHALLAEKTSQKKNKC